MAFCHLLLTGFQWWDLNAAPSSPPTPTRLLGAFTGTQGLGAPWELQELLWAALMLVAHTGPCSRNGSVSAVWGGLWEPLGKSGRQHLAFG